MASYHGLACERMRQGTGPDSHLNQDYSLCDKGTPKLMLLCLLDEAIHRTLSNTCWIREHPLGLSGTLLTNGSTFTKLSHNISGL